MNNARLILRHIQSSSEALKSAALGAGSSCAKVVGAVPVGTDEAGTVLDSNIVGPDGLGVLLQEGLVGRVGLALVELLQVAGEDSLELEVVAGAGVRGVAGVNEDAIAVDKVGHGGVGDGAGGGEVG